MADWRKIAKVDGDVVFFEYIDEKIAKMAPQVYVWDLDKTYLDTNINSIRAILRTAREKAFQKKNIPGTASLVRALIKKNLDPKNQESYLPLYFITASPPQMQEKIKSKLSLDNVNPFGAIFKDNLRNLKPNRFRRLTQHVGYKLQALMQLRIRLKEDVKQIMWGDDSETDALIYSLYSDICAERIDGEELVRTLESLNVLPQQLKRIFELKDEIPKHDPVERVYINLASDTDPDYYMKFGRRTLPTFNTFQIALDLFQNDKIPLNTLVSLSQVLISTYGFSREELFWSFEDLIQRNSLKKEVVEKINMALMDSQMFLHHFNFTQKTIKILNESTDIGNDWIPQKIDYLNDYR